MITKEEIESLGWYTTDNKFYYLDDKRVTSHSGEYFLDGHLVSCDSYEMFKDKNNIFSIINLDAESIFKGKLVTKSELEFIMKLTMYETI